MESILEDAWRLKTTPVPIRPGLSLYRQPKGPGVGSPNWYARARIKIGGRTVHAKSTGTTDLRIAKERAEEYYADLLIARRHGVLAIPGSKSAHCFRFDIVADAFLDALIRDAGDDRRRLQRARDYRSILLGANGLCRFFRATDIRAITPNRIREFLAFAEKRGRHGSLRPTTQRNKLATLRPVLAFAVDEGLLDRVPKMPTVRMRDNPRSSFSRSELDQLLAKCRLLADEASSDIERDRWLELHDFIIFMIATFLRPSEWVDLKHGNISVIESASTPHLKIAVTRGKTGKRMVVSMPEAVDAYARICKRSGRDSSTYLFAKSRSSRDGAIAEMRRGFAQLLAATNLLYDPLGAKRVIYCLRHTALTLRMIEGDKVNLLLLARNAGTSTEMLERFYLSRVTPQDDLENLQSRRQPEKVRGLDRALMGPTSSLKSMPIKVMCFRQIDAEPSGAQQTDAPGDLQNLQAVRT